MSRNLWFVISALMAVTVTVAGQPQPEIRELAPDEFPSHVVKVLRTSNKAQTNRYVPKVYEFNNVNPYAVVRFFQRVMEIEEGAFYTFSHPADHLPCCEGDKGLVLVLAPHYQIPYLDRLMATLDRKGMTTSSGSKRVVARLKHRSAIDRGLLNSLLATGTPDAEIVSDLEINSLYLKAAPSGSDNMAAWVEKLDVPTPEVLIDVTLYEIDLNNDGTIGLDFHAWKNGPGRNLFAFGAFAEYERVDRLKGGGGRQFPVYDSGFNTHGLPHHRFRNHGYNVAYFYDVPSAYFDFLVAKGVARVVTSGRLMSMVASDYLDTAAGAPRSLTGGVLNRFGQAEYEGERATRLVPAVLTSGEEILYYLVHNGPSARAGARPPGLMLDPYGDNIDYPDNRTVVGRLIDRAAGGTTLLEGTDHERVIASVPVGLNLTVTPQIGTEHIILDLSFEVSSLLGFDGEGIPRISARRANAQTRVNDGEEIVFGGLKRTRRIQTTRKVPILGSIPVLGWAFGGEISTVKKTVVVAVLRASQISDFSGLSDGDKATIDQVTGPAKTPLPAEQWGFDQWLLDKGK